jgi:chromosome partitioning protein
VIGTSHYSEMVREARRQRRIVDGKMIDWVVVRNRLSALGSRNRRLVGAGANDLARQLGFRFIDGFSEQVVYRELFPRGLTALDELDGQNPLGGSGTHQSARREVETLVRSLRLPTDERGRRRAAARAEWSRSAALPLELHDILTD